MEEKYTILAKHIGQIAYLKMLRFKYKTKEIVDTERIVIIYYFEEKAREESELYWKNKNDFFTYKRCLEATLEEVRDLKNTGRKNVYR